MEEYSPLEEINDPFDCSLCPDGREHVWEYDALARGGRATATHADFVSGECARCGVGIYGPPEPERLGTLPYPLYLKTVHWRDRRREAVERAQRRCQLCNSDDAPLQVHHRTYERRGDEHPTDLIALCRDCHARFHDRLPAPPRTLPPT